MKNLTCGNCKFGEFAPLSSSTSSGACHLDPPVPLMFMTQNALGQASPVIQPIFPPVFQKDWCGKGEAKLQ